MTSHSSCPFLPGWAAAVLAGALAILIGILFGFGLLPFIPTLVYVLIGLGALGAILFVAALVTPAYRTGCVSRTARGWIAGFVGTIAAALAVLAFVGIAPAWLAGTLIGLLTLFTSVLLISITRFALCAAGAGVSG